MRIVFEGAVFLTAAMTAHLALWVPTPEIGSAGSGAEGEALLSINPSSASVAKMVESWEAPQLATETVAPEMDEPQMPTDSEFAQPKAPQTAAFRPIVPTLPKMATAPEAPSLPTYQKPSENDLRTPAKPEMLKVELSAIEPLTQSKRPKARPKIVKQAAQKSSPKEPAIKPVKTSKATSQATTARTAKGAGTGTAKGTNQASRTATLSDAKKTSLMTEWGGHIRSRIARRAPRGVGRGTAIVQITVSGNGALIGVQLSKSSGNSEIDKLAMASVRKAGRFPAAPRQLGVQQHTFRLPIKSK